MATPEIVLGASLLTMFVSTVQAAARPEGLLFPLGIPTILIAHIMFNISYVVVTVKARLAGFPRHLEEAAMDLGANEWTTFWKVTFPLILPGVIAAALLAFSLSIDDYVITTSPSGRRETFPLYIYGSQAARHPGPGQRHRHDHLRVSGAAGRDLDADAAPPGDPRLHPDPPGRVAARVSQRWECRVRRGGE